MIKEISTFILQRLAPHPYWERDINFFVGHIPVRNKDGMNILQIPRIVAILENSAADVTGYLPDRADKPIQVLNRNDNFFEAREDAYEIYDLLHGLEGCDLPVVASGGDYVAMIIDAMSQPYPIENPDGKGRYAFTTNYLFRIRQN